MDKFNSWNYKLVKGADLKSLGLQCVKRECRFNLFDFRLLIETSCVVSGSMIVCTQIKKAILGVDNINNAIATSFKVGIVCGIIVTGTHAFWMNLVNKTMNTAARCIDAYVVEICNSIKENFRENNPIDINAGNHTTSNANIINVDFTVNDALDSIDANYNQHNAAPKDSFIQVFTYIKKNNTKISARLNEIVSFWNEIE
jgi:hypothetical protein